MFEVVIAGQFAAAHRLPREDGSHEPVHEHEWRVEVTYAGSALDQHGMLIDFTAVRARLSDVLAALREQPLHELPAFAERSASAENVAVHIAEQMAALPTAGARLRCVQVEEEPGCFARYWPEE